MRRASLILVLLSWIMFQGLPILAGEALPSNPLDLVPSYGVLAVASLVAFLAGAWWVGARLGEAPAGTGARGTALDGALGLAVLYLWLSAPLLLPWSAVEGWNTARQGYGNVEAISRPLNLALYVNLSMLPVVLWNCDVLGPRRYWALLVIIVLPRALIALGGGRFFVLQALIPIALWEARRMRRLVSARAVVGGAAGLLVILWGIPALRGDAYLGLAGLVAGSPLGFVAQVEATGVLRNNTRSELVGCEIVANATSLDVCSLREVFGVPREVPARLDQATTWRIREMTGFDTLGTGGNPVVEAFPRGELSWGLLWFALAGGLLLWTVDRSRTHPVACYLLPHVAAKSLFLWRGTLSEIFERIPLILLSYALLWAVVQVLVRYAAVRARA
jgi:hypothetical protein